MDWYFSGKMLGINARFCEAPDKKKTIDIFFSFCLFEILVLYIEFNILNKQK